MISSGRIVFVNRFYWPEEPATAQLLTDLAEALAADGHSIAIVASAPNDCRTLHETRNGVEIFRIRGSRLGRRSLLGRAMDFCSFSFGAHRLLSRLLRAGDTLVTMTDPPLLGMFTTRLGRRRGVRSIHWIQDIYPEIAMNVSGARMLAPLRAPRDRAWREADCCVVLGRDMASFVQERGVEAEKIVVCPNWAPSGLAPLAPYAGATLRGTWRLQNKFVIAYSGNLGRVHDLEPLLDVAEALRSHPDVAFVFVGGGGGRATLEESAKRRGLDNIHFHPPQPRAQLGETLALADVHVITLREGCERLVFPSKLYGIAAVGRPVVFVGPDCELADLLHTHSFGEAYRRNDISAIADAFVRLKTDATRRGKMALAATEFSLRHGHLEHALPVWQELLGRAKPLAGAARPSEDPLAS